MPKLALGLLFVFLAGCGSDPGAISVRWNIGLNDTCENAGIETVLITLTDEDGGMLGPFQAPCTAGRDGFTIDDVDTGSYLVSLEGVDGEGRVIYSGRSSARFSVQEGQTASTPAIMLSPAPARLTIQWKFEDGRTCALQEGPPTEVEVHLLRNNTEPNFSPMTASCDAGQVVFPDLEASNNYDVRATALGRSGNPLYRFEELDVQLAEGEQMTILGTFVSCAAIGGCQ